MTPETIYRLNPNREQAVEALRAQGYITGRGQVSGGALRGQYEATYEGRRMTAAERRVFVATRNWEEVQAGLNPYTAAAVERHGGARIGGQDRPLTPFDRARAEAEYYAATASNGEAGLMRRLFRSEYKALAADI